MLPWKLWKCQILPVNQNLTSVYFSLAKFQLVSCNSSLAMIWQMTYSQTAKTVFSHLKDSKNFFLDGGLDLSFGRSKSTFRGFRTENCKYLFNATENVSLYCKQFEVHWAYLLFISSVVKHAVFWSQFFCHIFSGKSFLQFICTTFIIKHRIFPYTLCQFLV